MNKKKFLEGLDKYLKDTHKYFLTEGRKNDVTKKYPILDQPVLYLDRGERIDTMLGVGQQSVHSFAYAAKVGEGSPILDALMEHDISGNYKYLMWMANQTAKLLKAATSPESKRKIYDLWKLEFYVEGQGWTGDISFFPSELDEGDEKINDFMARAILGYMMGVVYDSMLYEKWERRAPELYEALDTFPKILSVSVKFHRLLPYMENKDIYSFKDADTLSAALDVATRKQFARQQEKDKKKAAKAGARIIWEEGKVAIIRPETEEASCLFGKGTKWCVSARDDNWFRKYTKQGKAFYFFFFPGHTLTEQADPREKVALVLNTDGTVDSVYDAEDRPMTWEEFYRTWVHYNKSKSWEGKFDEVMELIRKDVLRNNPKESGIDRDKAREMAEMVENEYWVASVTDIADGFRWTHRYDIEEHKDPLSQRSYISVVPSIDLDISMNMKLVKKLERWEEMHGQGPKVPFDVDAFIDSIFTPTKDEAKARLFQDHIEKNVEKIVNNLLNDQEIWPVSSQDAPGPVDVDPDSPLKKYHVTYVAVSTMEDRQINIDIQPVEAADQPQHPNEGYEFTDTHSWWEFLQGMVKQEKYLNKKLKEKLGTSLPALVSQSIEALVRDTLADAGIAAPRPKEREATGQLDLPLDHYPLDDITQEVPYTLQEKRMKKK